MKPYQMSEEQMCATYNAEKTKGLSESEAAEHQKQFGKNLLPEKGPDSWIKIFVRQFQNPLIYILLVAALIIFFVGTDTFDAFIITGILLFNALVGTIQEGRTSRILATLKTFITSDCVVIRDGQTRIINAAQLVPGDLVLLQQGQRVPADMRLLTAHNLHVDEAILTGESLEVLKDSAAIMQTDLSISEQRNMVFKGTYVLTGSGKGIVVGTGVRTEIGRIHASAREIQTEIPLKKELNRLSVWILLFVVTVCVILFIAGMVTGKPLKELLVTLTALFICVVPEGLPVVLTLVLVSGVYRMAKLRVLVKKMQAVETLGRTDVIVIDKTGTLTRNEMMVSDVWSDNIHWRIKGQGYYSEGLIYKNDHPVDRCESYPNFFMLGKACILLSNGQVSRTSEQDRFTIQGDPTEVAMAILGQKMGITRDSLEKEWIKVAEVPFDSKLKYHAVVCLHNKQGVIFVSGAPETIFTWVDYLPPQVKNELGDFLEKGLRVVAVAYKMMDGAVLESINSDRKKIEALIFNRATFLGLCGIQDAIRNDVAPVIEQTRSAGLSIIMATGDHQKTALYVAKTVGIFREGDRVINGKEFESISVSEQKKQLGSTTVYSRVTPVNKLNLIRLLHKQGHVVAMTGDGVNDVPALVAADIGIAMGSIGTEVAKEVADIILLDDSFVRIVTAIKQGRHIFYTLRRVILYFFATNMGEVLIMLFAMSYLFINPGFPLPLTAAQILWLNLITDGFLDVALSMEPIEKGLLDKKMITKHQHLVDSTILKKTLFMALPMAVGSLGLFMLYYKEDTMYARTVALMSMAMFQWFNAWNCRSERKSIFSLGLFSNPWLIASTLFVLFLQLSIVYVPALQTIFKTVSLSLQDWIVICIVASSVLFLEELRKWIAHDKENNISKFVA